MHLSARAAPPSSFPELRWASGHQASVALKGVCEHLSVLYLDLLCPPIARCVIRNPKSPREVIFEAWDQSKIFLYKLMVIGSPLSAIAADERLAFG